MPKNLDYTHSFDTYSDEFRMAVDTYAIGTKGLDYHTFIEFVADKDLDSIVVSG